jgi:hypothetical protein
MNYPILTFRWKMNKDQLGEFDDAALDAASESNWDSLAQFLRNGRMCSDSGRASCREILLSDLSSIYKVFRGVFQVYKNTFRITVDRPLDPKVSVLMHKFMDVTHSSQMYDSSTRVLVPFPNEHNVLKWSGPYVHSFPTLSLVMFFMARSFVIKEHFGEDTDITSLVDFCKFLIDNARNLFSNDNASNRTSNAFFTGMALWKACGNGMRGYCTQLHPTWTSETSHMYNGIAEYMRYEAEPREMLAYAQFIGLNEDLTRNILDDVFLNKMGIGFKAYMEARK